MKTLIVEDDFTSRVLLQEILKDYGPTHVAVNGKEAVEAVRQAIRCGDPYDLVCLDIMMPEMDVQQALKEIRALERTELKTQTRPTKIFMTTALAGRENVMEASSAGCDWFLVKPIRRAALIERLRERNLI